MSVTLADVAAACGTSASTVSRALSKPDSVNAATRERIYRVARELGYVLNAATRTPPGARTGIIGLIVPDIANPIFPPIIKAVQQRAGSRHHAVLVADIDERAPDEITHVRAMSKLTDGIIMVSPQLPDDSLAELLDLSLMVFINRHVEGASGVLIDDRDGINEAVEHLVALGHKQICYLNGPRRSLLNMQRREAMVAACDKYAADLTEFGPFEPQIQAGVRAADLVCASGATAVVAFDDAIALGVMARLAERGLRVGHDMSVIGIDDGPMSGVAYPTLTSIHVPGAEAGIAAVSVLLDLLGGVSAPTTTVMSLETRLEVRGSTGPASLPTHIGAV